MQDEDHIVFVEVRYRSSTAYGLASETINGNKQNKLLRAANYFLLKKRLNEKVNSRFDVITIQADQGQHKLEWIKDAF